MPLRDFRKPLAALLATLALAGHSAVSKDIETSGQGAPLIAPMGITLSSARTGASEASGFKNALQKTAQTVFADAKGLTLYYADDNGAACDDACRAEWTPLAADSEPTGEWGWSVIPGPDGMHQWAYQGKALYTYTKDTAPGQAAGHGVGPWHAAVVQHPLSDALPDEITVAAMNEAPGEVLATADGFAIYAFSDKHRDSGSKCAPSPCGAWKPIVAPALAHATGEFTIVAYDPGLRQWAFRGKPLYRYADDGDAGDVRGRDVDPEMTVALLARYFMPADVAMRPNHFGGISLVTSQGMTLYTRDAATPAQGQSLRVGIHGNPSIGRRLGTEACDAHCATMWTPLLAPANAVAAGYWAPLRRDGGAKQWAYNGYALYSYTGDHAPGDVNGFDIYEYDQPGQGALKSTTNEKDGGVTAFEGLRQLHWRAVVP